MKRLSLLIFILLSSLCAGLYTFFPNTSLSFGNFSMFVPDVVQEEKVPVVRKEKILFVGDVMLARNVEKLMDTYGSEYPFSELPKKPEDTYIVGNFEASVPATHVPTENLTFSFSVASKYLANLSAYGFSHLGLANNHSYDFGSADFENTLQSLTEASVVPFGNPKNFASSTIPLVQIGSSTVALIGVYGVNVDVDEEVVTKAIVEAAKVSDLQVVYIHWGDEYQLVHNKTQENLAHVFVDAGADVVIGHHPHVVQDIEQYKNGIIFYSLGNFIFDQYFSNDVQEGLGVELSFASSSPTFLLMPVTSVGSRSVPRHMSPYEKDMFLLELSKNSDTELKDMVVTGRIKTGI